MLPSISLILTALGSWTAANLKQRLGAFYRNLPQKEIKLLLGDGTFTKDALRSLLQNNDLGAFDPTKEAFKAYDPNNTGFVDTDTLRSIFESLGYGEITDEDLQVLIETADVDGDGRISLSDFQSMLAFTKPPRRMPQLQSSATLVYPVCVPGYVMLYRSRKADAVYV